MVRVHDLVPKKVWSKRYKEIRAFERNLADSGTLILKFFLHISSEEQLDRFRKRLDDPQRHWKISESDYAERKFWGDYQRAYEDALAETSTDYARWFIIPSNHKWFRNLAISNIIVDSLHEAAPVEDRSQGHSSEVSRRRNCGAKQKTGGDGEQRPKRVAALEAPPRMTLPASAPAHLHVHSHVGEMPFDWRHSRCGRLYCRAADLVGLHPVQHHDECRAKSHDRYFAIRGLSWCRMCSLSRAARLHLGLES